MRISRARCSLFSFIPFRRVTWNCMSHYYFLAKKHLFRPFIPRALYLKVIEFGMDNSIEKKTSKKFGDLKNPLLVSVRSGARISMPGMMDTILNLGLNDQTVIALANKTKNIRFAKDSYRRFIQMYSDVVLGIEAYNFEDLIY